MPGSYFHLDRQGSLNALRPAPFVSDAEMQTLVAVHPSLLAGDTETDQGLFMIERVGPPPAGAAHTPRWSLDHLFLARDAIPTVVETHRANTDVAEGDLFGRILRYAANAVRWWPETELREAFAATHAGPRVDPARALARLIGSAQSADAYWRQVAANLAAGRVRMVLVVDRPEPELASTVEFLGGQLRDAEVRLLQIRQQTGSSGRVLQLILTGAPQAAQAAAARADQVSAPARTSSPAATVVTMRPAAPASSGPTREAWVKALRARLDPDEALVFDDLLRWMSEQYGATAVAGPPHAAIRLSVKEAGKDRAPFAVTSDKRAVILLSSLAASRAYESADTRHGLVRELRAAGIDLPPGDANADVKIPLKDCR